MLNSLETDQRNIVALSAKDILSKKMMPPKPVQFDEELLNTLTGTTLYTKINVGTLEWEEHFTGKPGPALKRRILKVHIPDYNGDGDDYIERRFLADQLGQVFYMSSTEKIGYVGGGQ